MNSEINPDQIADVVLTTGSELQKLGFIEGVNLGLLYPSALMKPEDEKKYLDEGGLKQFPIMQIEVRYFHEPDKTETVRYVMSEDALNHVVKSVCQIHSSSREEAVGKYMMVQTILDGKASRADSEE